MMTELESLRGLRLEDDKLDDADDEDEKDEEDEEEIEEELVGADDMMDDGKSSE